MTEEKEEIKEESKFEKERTFLFEIKALLNDYPFEVGLTHGNELIAQSKNLILIYDLLNHCFEKSKKDDFKERVHISIKELEEKKIKKIMSNYYKLINTSLYYAQDFIKGKLFELMDENRMFFNKLFQKYILVMPKKAREDTHYRTGHGLPAQNAEEYESGEVQEGEKVGINQSFKVDDEGRVNLV